MPETIEAPAAETTAQPSAFERAFEKAAEEKGEALVVAEPKPEKPTKVEAPTKTAREVPAKLFEKAKPADAPPESKSEIDAIAEPTFKDEKGKHGWEALKTSAKTFEKKAVELEKKIADYEAKGKSTADLEARLSAVEKEKAEMSDVVSKARIQSHPDYIKKHITGRRSLVDEAGQVVTDSGGNAKDISVALNLRGKEQADALAAVAENMSSFQAAQLGEIVRQIRSLDKEGDEKITRSENYWKELQAQDEQRVKQQKLEYAKSDKLAFESSAKRMASELEVLNKVEGLEWWNEQVDGILKKAQADFETNENVEYAADVMIRAHTQPIYRNLYLQERENTEAQGKKMAEMEKELADIYKRSPGLSGSKTESGSKKGNFFATLENAAVGGE